VGTKKSQVSFAAPYPGKIIPVQLNEFAGSLICQKDAFLCSGKRSVDRINFKKKIGEGFFGGGRVLMEKLSGDGLVFLHAGGKPDQKELAAGRNAGSGHRLYGCDEQYRRLRCTFANDLKSGRLAEKVIFGDDQGPRHVGCCLCLSGGWPRTDYPGRHSNTEITGALPNPINEVKAVSAMLWADFV
jgi:hypothetical protein